MNKVKLFSKAKLVLVVTSLLFFQNSNSFGQKVVVTLKDKRVLNAEVKVSSYDQLYFTDGSKVFYAEISSVNFITFNASNEGVIEKLVDNKITFSGAVPDNYKNYYEVPHKGDEKIILICSDSSTTLYKRIGKHLARKGYMIEHSDKDFLTIRTLPKAVGNWTPPLSYFLNLFIDGNTIIITARFGTFSHEFSDWDYTSTKEPNTIAGQQGIKAMVYNDIIIALTDFDKVKVKYQ